MYLAASRRSFSKRLVLISGLTPFLATSWANRDQDDKSRPANKISSDDDVYEAGGDVKPPRLVHYVEPDFSSSSKEAFVEGVVKISAVIMTDGTASKLKVTGSLNAEEDGTAIAAVKQWRFAPGTKKGQPVKVRVTVEVMFHLL